MTDKIVINENTVHTDVIFRVKRLDLAVPKECYIGGIKQSTLWYVRPFTANIGGNLGCYASVRDARLSAARMKIKNYEVYAFHIGTTDSEWPYFMPTKVFEYG